MSEIADLQNASKQDDTQEETAETAEIDNEETSLIEESDSSELSEKLSKTESEGEQESIQEEEQKETPSHEKSQKEETSDSELATITRSASSDDGMPASISGTAVKQVEPDEPRIPSATAAEDAQQRHVGSGPSTTVGEWNSLPVLVERLREALELSLAAGHRRGGGGGNDEPTSTSFTEPVDIDRSRARHSMEQALLTGCDHDDLESKKDELKFLEDLLLSDIQTALARLRETLERTDVATLAKHGGVSDPTSKLHLLRLVSSLLSRLQVPEEETAGGENRTIDIAVQSGDAPVGRKRRAVRHTIGVSAEEIAHARKQLEENSANLARLSDRVLTQRRELLFPVASHNATNSERHMEEIHDKYTKDAINQRQSLRDKNKDSHGDIGAYRLLTPSQIDYADRPIAAETVSDANAHRNRRRGSVDSYREKETDDEEAAIERANEEQSRVTKLAAALRQRAEFLSANRNNNNNNKFTAKKSKIKRANTIDIPSYLKLQAGNLGYDNPGCILLRRPIDVSDKITSNTSNLVVPPSFHPRTENDKKFLALINRNNETQAPVNNAPAFVKSFGYTKRTDTPSLTHENWNSRFSNIKTAFDKPSSAVNEEGKASFKPHPFAKRSPQTFAPQTSMNRKAPINGTSHSFPFANANVTKSDAGFRHASSSLFREIEKSQTPKSPPIWQRENAPGNTLREKARIMFDRDSSNVQSQPPSKFNVNKNSQKSTFPRPPWIEHGRNEGNKSSNMVTENGRLDYRLFCKQFAPFIGKNTAPESKKSQNIEEPCKRNQHSSSKNVVSPSERKLGATNGRIPTEMFLAQESRIGHYYPNEPRCEVEEAVRHKIHGRKNTFEPAEARNDKIQFDIAFAKNAAAFDATLGGGSSVPIRTAVNGDAHPEEAHVFRVTPKISKNLSRNNEPKIELGEQWLTSRDEHNGVSPILESNYHSENPGHLILDHNRNYHFASAIDVAPNETLPSTNKNLRSLVKEDTARVLNPTENVPFPTTSDSPAEEQEIFQIQSPNENSVLFKPAVDNRSQIYSNYPSGGNKFSKDLFENHISNMSYENDKKDFPRASADGALPGEQNIQNQDISADAGVITRYTCAIATVASADIPEARSEGIRPESRASFSSSPSQLGSYSKATSISDATENEIRRHNMLQQSLVRQLQNERVMLNDYRDALITPNQPFNQSLKLQPPENPKRLEPRKLEPLRRSEPPIVAGLLSVAPSSASGMSRVTVLRGQYEQPDGQSKSVQKERSPIPSDAIDSSDEYLVSCANKPSRSIVLSKSESWHQLALSRNHHSTPRLSQSSLPPQPPLTSASYLPPKPKSKSPSPYRMKKQYEASSSSDNVKKMENKIRRYFDNPTNDNAAETRDSKGRRFSSRDSPKKHGLIGLARSRTMPGICDESRLRLVIPTQISVSNLNTADVDKEFDDIFEEATRADDYHF